MVYIACVLFVVLFFMGFELVDSQKRIRELDVNLTKMNFEINDWIMRYDAVKKIQENDRLFRCAFVDQACIDEVLTKLATAFNEACLREVCRQQLPFEEYDRAFAELRAAVESRKKAFWDAHGLAKAIGYQVRENFSNYLPSEERS